MIDMDDMDVRILEALQRDARYSYSALSRLVHLSTPSVANRARKLEEAGVITSYRAHINPRSVGWTVDALVRLACHGTSCILKDPKAIENIHIMEIHRVTGPYCSILRVVAGTMDEFELVVDDLTQYGSPTSELILSSQISEVLVPRSESEAHLPQSPT
jgi:Lrp/AsnC family leucine-responsive transcriptional regulator